MSLQIQTLITTCMVWSFIIRIMGLGKVLRGRQEDLKSMMSFGIIDPAPRALSLRFGSANWQHWSYWPRDPRSRLELGARVGIGSGMIWRWMSCHRLIIRMQNEVVICWVRLIRVWVIMVRSLISPILHRSQFHSSDCRMVSANKSCRCKMRNLWSTETTTHLCTSSTQMRKFSVILAPLKS